MYRTHGYSVAKCSWCHLGTEIGTSDINLVTGIDKLNKHVADMDTSMVRGVS